MANLQIPQNIDAKKIIDDASVLGIGVLNKSQEASIYQAEKDIQSAQGDVRRANTEVNGAEDKQKNAEAKNNEAQNKQKDGESKSQSRPTEDSIISKGNDANTISQASKTRSQSMAESSERLSQSSSIFGNTLEATTAKIDGFSIEISNIEQQNNTLIEQNRSLVTQMEQESTFDGTGSGTRSAYSLSTATEVEEEQRQNSQISQQGQSSANNYQETINSNNAQIAANGSKIDAILQQSQAEQQALNEKTSQAQSEIQAQQTAAEQAQNSNQSEQNTLKTIGDYAKTATNIGATLDSVGDVVKVAGVGVTAAGTALTATGGAVGVTGATVTGVGAVITAIGAPLCALFGIGVPIVGAGGTTTGSGIATSTVGGTVAGTGGGLVGTGSTIQSVGNGLSTVGNGLRTVGELTTAGVKIAEGDVTGAMHATASAISSAAAFSSTIASSSQMAGVFDKVYNGAAAVREGIATYQSAESGDIAGAIAHGVSAIGLGVGASDFKYKRAVSDISQGVSATTGAVQSAMDGDYTNAALQGTQALFNFASGAGNYKITKSMDAVSIKNNNEISNDKQAIEDDATAQTQDLQNKQSTNDNTATKSHDSNGDDEAWSSLIQSEEDAIWTQREEWAKSGQGRVYYHEDGSATIISSNDADILHSKTKNLLGKGANTEFGEGIEGLQAKMLDQGARKQNALEDINVGGGNAKVRDWSGAFRIGASPELVQDAADLSQFAYSPHVGQESKLNGWRQVAQTSDDNGFHAKAFVKDKQVIIAFRGSDDVADLKVDHQMLAGRLPAQFGNANQFVQQLKETHPNCEIIVTGHSLGGSLAELTASKHKDIKGITFDAVGVQDIIQQQRSRLDIGLADNENTLNYVVRGDIISNANKHVGTTVVVDGVRGHDEHAIQNFTGINNSLVGTEGGLTSIDSKRRSQIEQTRARNGNTLEAAISNANYGVVRFDDKQFKEVKKQLEIDANSLNADLDRLQKQVNRVVNTEQRKILNEVLDKRRKVLNEDCAIERRSKVIRTRTGDDVNEDLRVNKGFKNPAFLPGQTPEVNVIELTQNTRFVRVFNEDLGKDSSYAKGVWVMALKDIEGLTPAQIKDKFALPSMPSHVVELELPQGTELITGPCNPLEGWGNGGGIQYFITGEKSHKYFNIRNLPPNPQ